MLRVLSILLLATLLLAGCTQEPADAPRAYDPGGPGPDAAGPGVDGSVVETEQPPAPPGEPVMTVSGVVQDEDAGPLPGATVTLLGVNRTRTTDAAGAFVFENVPVGFHALRADATDFLPAEVTARPAGDGETVSVVLVLQRFAEEPYQQTVEYHGMMQCAAEYVIITPNCDEWLRAGAGTALFDGETVFQHQLAPNWRTVVLDLDFDEASQPGMDGLRVTVRGINDADSTSTYEQYARFYGASTYRVEPGAHYEDGTGAVPQNSTTFEYEVYPHSYGYHPACVGMCPLGVGLGLDVEFDLYATAFYVDAAPADWSLLS